MRTSYIISTAVVFLGACFLGEVYSQDPAAPAQPGAAQSQSDAQPAAPRGRGQRGARAGGAAGTGARGSTTSHWAEALETDPHDLKRYQAANKALLPPAEGEDRVVFMGDSITDSWARSFSQNFPGKPYIGRGVSSETTQQMLVRFHRTSSHSNQR